MIETSTVDSVSRWRLGPMEKRAATLVQHRTTRSKRTWSSSPTTLLKLISLIACRNTAWQWIPSDDARHIGFHYNKLWTATSQIGLDVVRFYCFAKIGGGGKQNKNSENKHSYKLGKGHFLLGCSFSVINKHRKIQQTLSFFLAFSRTENKSLHFYYCIESHQNHSQSI